ncbi:telomere-associated protein RIF1-like [Ciona intestinalis]
MSGKFQSFLNELTKKECSSERNQVYNSIIRLLKTSSTTLKQSKLLAQQLTLDFGRETAESSNILLSVIHALFDSDVTDRTEHTDLQTEILRNFSVFLKNSKSSQAKLLNELSNHNFPPTVVAPFVEDIVAAVGSISDVTIADQVITTVARFLSTNQDAMLTCINIWLTKLLSYTSHQASSTRVSAVSVIDEHIDIIVKRRDVIMHSCAGTLTKICFPALKPLYSNDEALKEILSSQVLVIMKIIGVQFKRSSTLLNATLEPVAKGFRHSKDEIKVLSFKAWDQLIEALGEDKEIMSSPKYINLLTQPIKFKAKNEVVLESMIRTSWKLVVKLEEKMVDLFELVCAPLIELCLGDISSRDKTSRRSSLRFSQLRQNLLSHSSTQLLSADVIGHMIMDVTTTTYSPRLTPLHSPYIGNPAVFPRFSSTLIPVICDVIKHLHRQLPDDFISQLWSTLVNCVNCYIAKKRDTDMFRSLFNSTNQIVNESVVPPRVAMTLVFNLSSFPTKILNSSLYYAGDRELGNVHGTPVLSVIKLLFTPAILDVIMEDTSLWSRLEELISIGMQRRIAILEFVHDVVKLFQHRHLIFMHLWGHLADHVFEYMTKSGNINQGDSFEHDFVALFSLLGFPLTFIFNGGDCGKDVVDDLTTTWEEIFDKFVEMSRLVSSVKRNEVVNKMIEMTIEKLEGNEKSICETETSVQFLTNITMVLVSNTNYTDLPTNIIPERKSPTGGSPKEKQLQPILRLMLKLGNLNSEDMTYMVDITTHVTHVFTEISDKYFNEYFLIFVPILHNLIEGMLR